MVVWKKMSFYASHSLSALVTGCQNEINQTVISDLPSGIIDSCGQGG